MSYLKVISITVFTVIVMTSSANALWIGDAAPAFDLEVMGDTRMFSLDELRGKVVFIDFWASWCGPCKKELPALNAFFKKQDPSRVAVVAINLDKKEANARKFLQKFPVSISILLDPKSEVVKKFGALAMPTSFILDENGTIRYVHLGYSEKDPDKWEVEINELLNNGARGAKL